MISDAKLREHLADAWGLAQPTIEAHHGGMNSATWFVSQSGTRWVAKAVVPAARHSFAAGLALACALEHAGIPAGAPAATRHGTFVVDVDTIPLALLTWVPGRELSATDPQDQQLIGTTLARVHRALLDVPVPHPERFPWLDPHSEHLAIRPWLRGAIAAAVEAYDHLAPETLTWGPLHTDPAPEAFRLNSISGACGLIDWPTAMTGPLLYDLASAVMYAGGPDRAQALIDAYLNHGPIPRPEAHRALLVMLRLRWAVQADYFARRITTNDLTGIDTPADNEKGLADAQTWLIPLAGGGLPRP